MSVLVPLEPVRVSVLGLLLLAACVSDVRSRRIPNALVMVVALTGLAFSLSSPAPLSSLWHSLAGLTTGLLLWLPFHALRMLGAGDVKLFAAAAAWLGPQGALTAAAATALVGGVLALMILVAVSGVRPALARIATAASAPALFRQRDAGRFDRLPYAVAIAAGVLLASWRMEGL